VWICWLGKVDGGYLLIAKRCKSEFDGVRFEKHTERGTAGDIYMTRRSEMVLQRQYCP
jgi:hypothetical protein